jgi:hypothetical protein
LSNSQIESVYLDVDASAGEVAAVEEAFARAGFTIEARPVIAARSADLVPWAVVVALALTVEGFFQGFGSEAGKDAYLAVKEWVPEPLRLGFALPVEDTTHRLDVQDVVPDEWTAVLTCVAA